MTFFRISGYSVRLAGMLAVAVFLLDGSARADYIVNGNFSSTTVPGNANSLIYNTSNGASYINGWSLYITNTSTDLGFVYSGNYGQSISDQYGSFTLSDAAHVTASPAGTNFVTVDSDPGNSLALYQTLTSLSANTKYTLTYYQATDSQAGYSPSGSSYWSVYFGNSTDGLTPYTGPAMTDSTSFSGWQKVTMTIATGADAASESLGFFASGPSGGPPMLFLDGVSLVTATPEPSTLVICGMGLLALFRYCGKRRRQPPVI